MCHLPRSLLDSHQASVISQGKNLFVDWILLKAVKQFHTLDNILAKVIPAINLISEILIATTTTTSAHRTDPRGAEPIQRTRAVMTHTAIHTPHTLTTSSARTSTGKNMAPSTMQHTGSTTTATTTRHSTTTLQMSVIQIARTLL